VLAGMVTHAEGTAELCASEITLKAKRRTFGRHIALNAEKAAETSDNIPKTNCYL
jgi:hypothetical protein